jgi:hypothetical protein
MNSKAWEQIADGLVLAVRKHVAEKLEAHAAVNGELQRQLTQMEERIEALEARLAERENAPALRAIA